MKSTDGGRSWVNKGIFIEDKQPRMILKPHNTSVTFAGGVGDPSAVASGEWLYLFYGEYGYPGNYSDTAYNGEKGIEWTMYQYRKNKNIAIWKTLWAKQNDGTVMVSSALMMVLAAR